MEPPGSPSCYYHASQDILGEGRKLLMLLGVENEMEDFWADYPWDMMLSVVKKDPGKDKSNTAGTGCSYCNKINRGTWSFIPPWNWNDHFIFLKPIFTIHLIYPPKYLRVRICKCFPHPIVGVYVGHQEDITCARLY